MNSVEESVALVAPWTNAFTAVNLYMRGEGISEPIESISELFKTETLEQDFDGFMKYLKVFLDNVVELHSLNNSSALDNSKFLFKLIENWISFYSKTLPFLQMILAPMDEILEHDKIRTLAIQAFGNLIVNENKLKLFDLFSNKKPEMTDGMGDEQITSRINQMLHIIYEAFCKRLYLENESQNAHNELAQRRASMADASRKLKVGTSRRSSFVRSNTIKGIFKQQNSRVSFQEKQPSKNYLTRKSYAGCTKDILELIEEFEKTWINKPINNSNLEILLERKKALFQAKNVQAVVEQPLEELSSKDLTGSTNKL